MKDGYRKVVSIANTTSHIMFKGFCMHTHMHKKVSRLFSQLLAVEYSCEHNDMYPARR